MPKIETPWRRALPLALLAAPLLTACGPERVRLALPPLERTEPVAYPAIPPGEAVCEDLAGGRAPCLSDRETAQVIAGLADALDAANARLLWLRDWIAAAGK